MTPAQFLEFILSISIQATVVVCITHWLCRIVEVPRLQCRLWNCSHMLIAAIVFCGLLFPHLRTTHPWKMLPQQYVAQMVTTEFVAGKALFLIWITGVAVSLILMAREWLRVFRFLKSCRAASDTERQLFACGDDSPLKIGKGITERPVRLLISDHLGSPFCCQWHEPQLVIPEFMLNVCPEEIRFVARHELEHLQSGHPLHLFIERLVAIAFWFHPTIWWASQQASLAREYACDDAAVNERREIVNYLKILVAIAERGMTEEAEGAALFFGRGASIIALRGRRLVQRANTISSSEKPADPWWTQIVQTASALTACCLFWIPVDVLASSQTHWSPWPQWSAQILRTFDMPVRDFEPYEIRTRLHEITLSKRHGKRPVSGTIVTTDRD